MESKNLYVPNHKKWLDYFQKVFHHEKQSSHSYDETNQNIISDNKSSNLYIIPIEESGRKDIIDKQDKIQHKVTLISPSQQTVEQAESELKRTKMKGVKRVNTNRKVSKGKQPVKKQHVKKRSKKIDKNKKRVQKKQKLKKAIFV